MKKAELLKCLEQALRKGQLKDPSIITKVECASEEALEKWDCELTKMYGGAGLMPSWYGRTKEQKEADDKASAARKEYETNRGEVPAHLHEHYDALRHGVGQGLSYGKEMSHEDAKKVLDVATNKPEGIMEAAHTLMDHRHTASAARKFLGSVGRQHKLVSGVK
jgi:G3E family GTPase